MIHLTHDYSIGGDGDSNNDGYMKVLGMVIVLMMIQYSNNDGDEDGGSYNDIYSNSDMKVIVMASHTPDNIWGRRISNVHNFNSYRSLITPRPKPWPIR